MPRFVILGQPRSGTTYLQTLLNSHRDIHCRGELFDPWQIDDDGRKTTDRDAVIARDKDPVGFFDAMMQGRDLGRAVPHWIGAKILFQHSPRVFQDLLAKRPDIAVLYVHRENKLAQFASEQQVHLSGRWTDTGANPAPAPKVKAHPFWASAQCNRLENEDYFLDAWLSALPNPLLKLRYTDLQKPATHATTLGFLGLSGQRSFTSALRKQGQNRIVDRFENAEEIAAYFNATGRAGWLGPELS